MAWISEDWKNKRSGRKKTKGMGLVSKRFSLNGLKDYKGYKDFFLGFFCEKKQAVINEIMHSGDTKPSVEFAV